MKSGQSSSEIEKYDHAADTFDGARNRLYFESPENWLNLLEAQVNRTINECNDLIQFESVRHHAYHLRGIARAHVGLTRDALQDIACAISEIIGDIYQVEEIVGAFTNGISRQDIPTSPFLKVILTTYGEQKYANLIRFAISYKRISDGVLPASAKFFLLSETERLRYRHPVKTERLHDTALVLRKKGRQKFWLASGTFSACVFAVQYFGFSMGPAALLLLLPISIYAVSRVQTLALTYRIMKRYKIAYFMRFTEDPRDGQMFIFFPFLCAHGKVEFISRPSWMSVKYFPGSQLGRTVGGDEDWKEYVYREILLSADIAVCDVTDISSAENDGLCWEIRMADFVLGIDRVILIAQKENYKNESLPPDLAHRVQVILAEDVRRLNPTRITSESVQDFSNELDRALAVAAHVPRVEHDREVAQEAFRSNTWRDSLSSITNTNKK